jgi:RNA polymerase sigma-70 factor, ECF subfamily
VAEIKLTELLGRASRGDRQAQEDLYRVLEPELRKLAHHRFLQHGARERVRITEVVDLAFLRLFPPQPGANAHPVHWRHRGHFFAFVSRNIMQVLIDLLRREPEKTVAVGGEAEAPGEELTRDTLLTLRDALDELEEALSPLHRTIVDLRFWGGCTFDEIAELTGTPKTTVFEELHIALAFLKDRLRASFPDFGRAAPGSGPAPETPPHGGR